MQFDNLPLLQLLPADGRRRPGAKSKEKSPDLPQCEASLPRSLDYQQAMQGSDIVSSLSTYALCRRWLRRKRGSTLFCWYNSEGRERSKVIGPAALYEGKDAQNKEAWALVGKLVLDKLVVKSDPTSIPFGELAEKYLAEHPFNKQSTRELHTQALRNLLLPRWSEEIAEEIAIEIDPQSLKKWMVGLKVESSTRGKYKSVMSGVYSWGQCENLIPRGEECNPLNYVKGPEFSQVTSYEAMALEIEDIFALLSGLKQPEYELTLLVVTCQLRISEALGLKWRDILWNRGLIAIRRACVHNNIQDGAKTKLSRSRVEAPKLLLDCLAAWRRETPFADDEDYIFPSIKLKGQKPRSASMLVEDYIRPAAILAGVIRVENGITYDREGEIVSGSGSTSWDATR
jgi:integrase